MTGAAFDAPAASPAALFGFYLVKTARNALREKLKRLREPRYLVGLIFGLGYFALILTRPNAPRVRGRPGLPVTPEILGMLLPAAAAALAALVLLGWLFRHANPSLALSEGEIQFLFPAPLSRRAVLHFALLRSQIGVFFSSFVMTIVLGRRALGPPWQTGLGLWLVLTALHFHFMALGFTKARWEERTPSRRRAAKTLMAAAVIAVLAVLAVTVADGLRRSTEGLHAGHVPSMIQLETVFLTGPLGRLPFWLLLPFRWLLAPVFAPSSAFFFASLPAALAVALVQYYWVAHTSVSFEEATLVNAARRAQFRARRAEGRLQALPSDRKRSVVPFALGAAGRPEKAIVWKNLLSFRRASLARSAAFVFGGLVLLFLISGAASFDGADAVAGTAIVTLATFATIFCSILPIGLRFDLRGDLEHPDLLKQWPLSSARVVAAELLAPALLSTFFLWGGLGAAVAIWGGRAWGARAFHRVVSASPAGFGVSFEGFACAALAAALFLPALVALTLVIQNAAVLAFPAWFPPGRKRAAGLEQTGTRLLSMFATLVLLTVALIPSSLLVALLFFAAWKTLGLWTLPLAGALAALPVLAEAAAGVFLLSKMFERFDPSMERTG